MSFTRSSHTDAKTRTPLVPAEARIQDKRVMAFGTFDLFHPGHVYYLSQAESLGDELIIVIARDTRVTKLKGRTPHDTEDIRLANVAHGLRNTQVILGDENDIFFPIRKYNPQVLAFGYDQRVPEDKIRELFPTLEIVRIGSYEPEKWKSSLIRESKMEREDSRFM